MKKGGKDGAKTLTGLKFERDVDFYNLIASMPGYEVRIIEGKAGVGVFFEGALVARCFRKNKFYKYLDEEGIRYEGIISKKWMPDDALLVIVRETLFIIEIKYQQVGGSVDEKLLTCDFKRKFFAKLVLPLRLKVEYVFVLHDWFKNPRYKDTLDYINSVNCHYIFGELPLAWLGLPIKKD